MFALQLFSLFIGFIILPAIKTDRLAFRKREGASLGHLSQWDSSEVCMELGMLGMNIPRKWGRKRFEARFWGQKMSVVAKTLAAILWTSTRDIPWIFQDGTHDCLAKEIAWCPERQLMWLGWYWEFDDFFNLQDCGIKIGRWMEINQHHWTRFGWIENNSHVLHLHKKWSKCTSNIGCIDAPAGQDMA